MLQFNGIEVKWVIGKLPLIIIILIVGIIARPFLIPSSLYQNILEDRLEKSSGLDFQFQGDFSFVLFPSIRLEADTIEFAGKLASDVETIGSVQKTILDIDLWQFITGNIHVNDFLLQSPNITITGDFTPYIPEWLRTNLSAARKEDIRYLEVLMHFIEDSVFNIARVSEGTILWNKKQDVSFDAQKLNISIEKHKAAKNFKINANVYVNDRSVDLAMRLQRPDDFLRGFRSKLSFELDSAPLRIDFKGNAAHRASFVAQGNMKLEIPSTLDFCHWLNPVNSCDEVETKILISSDLKLRDQRLQIEDTVYTDGDFNFTTSGAIDFKPITPEIIGTITVPPRPLKSLAKSFRKLKKANFNNLLLDTFDANIDIKYQGLSLPSGDILNPQVKLLLENGHLSVSSDKLNTFGGVSNFRMRWHKGLDEGYMDLRFDTHSLDLERLQKGFGTNLKMKGALKASFEVQSQGSTSAKLLETARVHGEFSILDGVFFHPDIVSSLNGKALDHFEFAEIKGSIKGEQGQLNSKDIRFIAPFVNVTGIASLNTVENQLKIHLTSQIPERKSPKGEIISEKQEGYVNISGPFDNLQIFSSVNKGMEIQKSDGLHSGLLPYTDDETIISEDDELVIKETDLLD